MSNVKSYVKQVLAKLTGDQDKVVAEKNYRKATSAMRGQIAAMESKIVDAEEDTHTKKEALDNVKYPVKAISELYGSQERYVEAIVEAQDELTQSESNLQELKDSKTYYENLLKEFEAEA